MGIDGFSRRKNIRNAFQAAVAAASLAGGAASADQLKLPAGTHSANRTISESIHRKAEMKRAPVTLEGAHSRQGLLEQHRHDAVAFFRDHPRLFDSITAPDLRNIFDKMETVNERSVKGTRYEFKGVPTGEAVLANEQSHGNGIALRFYEENPDTPGLRERFVLVTARHVAAGMSTPNGKEWTHHPRDVDVSVVELTREESIQYRPLFLGRKHKDTDLSGEIVSVLGIDSDKEKHFPSVLSPRLSASFFAADPDAYSIDWRGEKNWSQASESRIILLPPDELAPNLALDTNKNGHIDPGEQYEYSVAGMSGSPLVYLPEGGQGVEFSGLLVAGAAVKVDGKYFTVGYVVDQMQVWEAIRVLPGLDKQKNAERPREGASDGWVTRVEDQR